MAMAGADPVLPQDLVAEILSWIPVKDLLRFRCVSKTWKSLIFNPALVKLHLQKSSKNTHVLLTFEDERRNSRGDESHILQNLLSTIYDGCHRFRFSNNYFVVGVCNGLVCLLDSFDGDRFERHWVRFWNPATRIMSEFTPQLYVRSSRYKLGYRYVKWGFGYDASSDTYKVVAVLFNVRSQNWELRVQCLGDTRWRSVLTCPAGFSFLEQLNVSGQFVSGTINWLALCTSSSDYHWEDVTVNQLVILSFDMKNETCSYLSMPDGLLEVPLEEPYLGVLKGCLCLSHDHKGTNFVVWLTREFGVEKSWSQLLDVSYDHLQVLDSAAYLVNPLCMSEDDKVLLQVDYGKFVLVDLRDNRIDHIEGFHNHFSFSSYEYVQSLVLPYRS